METPTDPSGGMDPAGGGSPTVAPAPVAPAPGGGDQPPTGRSLLTDVAIGAVVIAVIAAAIWASPP